MIDTFAPANAAENAGFFVGALGRDENGDVLADGFVGSIAKDAFGAAVPTGNDAVKVFADDRVVGELDDGREPVPKFSFAFLDRDVAKDHDEAGDLAGFAKGCGTVNDI